MDDRYRMLMEELATAGFGRMKCRGNSMTPVLSNPSLCHYKVEDTYKVGDIVFCKVKGRFIDAHFITKVGADGRYMIANNKGHENGWTRTIYGRVVMAYDGQNIMQYRATR